MFLWDHMLAGYATIGYHYNSPEASDAFAQQTHRLVKQREGARCVRTNNATYLNDVDVLIDGEKTNFYSGSVVLDDDVFQQFTTVITPGGGFGPETVTSYDKRLYLTIWHQANGVPSASYVPVVEVHIRVEFEPVY